MILHATVVKLNQYLDDEEFRRVMRMVEASLEEGLETFELELHKIDDIMRMDLIECFATQGYTIDFDEDSQILEVSIE